MTTEKALREALDTLVAVVGLTAFKYEGQRKPLQEAIDNARAALSLPETQGEPVAGDVEWLHKFINCTPFGADAPAEDMQRAHRIVDSLYAAPPSQPAQGEAATEKLQKLDAIIQETRDFLDMVEMLSEEPDLDRSDTLRLLGVLNDYRAMLTAAPAAPTQDGTPLVCLRHGFADSTPPCWQWCGSDRCVPAKPTNGEGA